VREKSEKIQALKSRIAKAINSEVENSEKTKYPKLQLKKA